MAYNPYGYSHINSTTVQSRAIIPHAIQSAPRGAFQNIFQHQFTTTVHADLNSKNREA